MRRRKSGRDCWGVGARSRTPRAPLIFRSRVDRFSSCRVRIRACKLVRLYACKRRTVQLSGGFPDMPKVARRWNTRGADADARRLAYLLSVLLGVSLSKDWSECISSPSVPLPVTSPRVIRGRREDDEQSKSLLVLGIRSLVVCTSADTSFIPFLCVYAPGGSYVCRSAKPKS